MRRWALVTAALATFPGAAAAQSGSPAGPVPVELLAARRAALLERIGDGMAVVVSAEERDMERDYPQDSEFRQDNDFFYLTGLETRSSVLVLSGHRDGADQVILYVPARDPAEEVWTGPQFGIDEARAVAGIEDVRSYERAQPELRGLLAAAPRGRVLLKTTGAAAGCPPTRSECAARAVQQAAQNLRTKPLALEPELGDLRVVKDADEMRRLRRAIDITAAAQKAAFQVTRPGVWEYEIEGVIEYTFRRNGAERVGFPSIVGSGPNASILHYDKSRRRTEAGDLVVADIGAEFGYYTADVTRTFPVTGRFTDRQRDLYRLVLATQQAAIDSVRPGTDVSRLNAIAREYMRSHSGNLCAPDTCDKYFPHGLSHWLGMDIHDVGDYARKLEPGMVITIEPGIYLPNENIGIRIEDDLLVTESGSEMLSAGAPRDPAEIERIMSTSGSSVNQ